MTCLGCIDTSLVGVDRARLVKPKILKSWIGWIRLGVLDRFYR